MPHTFHIPVLGLAFSVDSPLKVAKYGISSVISIVDDVLIEHMRKFYALHLQKPYEEIDPASNDARARRITAYLDLLQDVVDEQVAQLKEGDLRRNPEVFKYFRLLPDTARGKRLFEELLQESDADKVVQLQALIRKEIIAGHIDVNIMSKVDKINKDPEGRDLEAYFSDASAALRGFANSKVRSSVVLSAGMNPRLYQYISELPAFLPDQEGHVAKQVILKVSDYRSACIQAKYLAKKGIWVAEFRIESGLNCGGHAFATEGYLLGPILEEFKEKRGLLQQELTSLYQQALEQRGLRSAKQPVFKLTVQGGIGTAAEQQFLLEYYQMDGTGWGSPFLLVPEATTVDSDTLQALVNATTADFYVSEASPLGVPFNNFRKSTAEKNRLERIAKGRPGAPCIKKYLVSNTEFTKEPICTASRKYQAKKITDLDKQNLSAEDYEQAYARIVEKTCLCEGLATTAYISYGIERKRKDDNAVAICPGPNMAYFGRIYSLEEMVSHIYGKINLLEKIERPSMFVKELELYIQHVEKQMQSSLNSLDEKRKKYFNSFIAQLHKGIDYYTHLVGDLISFPVLNRDLVLSQLLDSRKKLDRLAQSG